jgi:hypothetical protein
VGCYNAWVIGEHLRVHVKLLNKCFIRVQNWEKLSFERKWSSLQSDVVELKGELACCTSPQVGYGRRRI